MIYDVLIAGASFAGLAAAVQLRARRVLLVEPHEIGAVRTSACSTLLAVLQQTGTLDSLSQVHDRLLLHLGDETVEYPLPSPFCTFDYRVLCQRLLEQSDADVIRASVRGRQGHIVATTQGEFEAKVLIDASGWRAALATDSRQSREESSGRSFGLETSLQLKADGLHFYYDPSRLGYHMVGWMFPAGPTARIGLGSYRGCSRLGRPLQQFVLSHFGRDPADEHGGYFPSRRRPTMTGDVFRVGDAAGHCLPLTGEGIRPALFFGTMLGRLVQGFLAGDQTQAEAGRRYRSLVARHFWLYSCLLAAQRVLPALPLAGIKVVADVVRRPANLDWLFGTYGNAFDPVEVSWWRDTKADRRPRPRLAA